MAGTQTSSNTVRDVLAMPLFARTMLSENARPVETVRCEIAARYTFTWRSVAAFRRRGVKVDAAVRKGCLVLHGSVLSNVQ